MLKRKKNKKKQPPIFHVFNVLFLCFSVSVSVSFGCFPFRFTRGEGRKRDGYGGRVRRCEEKSKGIKTKEKENQ